MSVVVITGCSSGFGLESALAFARRGHTTYATMRDLGKADGLLERAAAEGLDIELLTLDVDDTTSVTSAIGAVEARHGAIDILVNNAGTDWFGSVETTDLEKARTVMETNFWGPVRTIQAALPAMRAKGGAVIINVSSVSGSLPGSPYSSWYSASKHALNALSESLFIELDGIDVRVACVDPGFFKTEMVRNSRAPAAWHRRPTPTEPIRRGWSTSSRRAWKRSGATRWTWPRPSSGRPTIPRRPCTIWSARLPPPWSTWPAKPARSRHGSHLPCRWSKPSPVPARGDEPNPLHHRAPVPTGQNGGAGSPDGAGLHWVVRRSDHRSVTHWFGAREKPVLTGRPTRWAR